eukprot:4822946-Pleurochrysis_carterae.AAC.1
MSLGSSKLLVFVAQQQQQERKWTSTNKDAVLRPSCSSCSPAMPTQHVRIPNASTVCGQARLLEPPRPDASGRALDGRATWCRPRPSEAPAKCEARQLDRSCRDSELVPADAASKQRAQLHGKLHDWLHLHPLTEQRIRLTSSTRLRTLNDS